MFSLLPTLPTLKKSSDTTLFFTVLYCRYYTEDSDHEMEVWVVVGDTGPAAAKQLTLVVTPFKVSRAN